MNASNCKACAHFLQHYIVDEQSCTPVNCGHCRYPRLKHRRPGDPACAHFEHRKIQDTFLDRNNVLHFLTTEFLQYVLSLELPPEQGAGDGLE